MSLPPVTVQIKRKATDEPVDYLRVHESHGKRQRTSDFVFSRQATPQLNNASTPSTTPQAVRRIKKLPRASSSPSLVSQTTQPIIQEGQNRGQEAIGQAQQIAPATDPALTQTPTSASQTPTKPTDVRRFHMSRSSISLPSKSPALGGGRVQKRSALFVERRPSPSSSQGATPAKALQESSPKPTPEVSRTQKKPGLAARIPAIRAPDSPTPAAPARDVRLPSGLISRWDLTSEELAAEMQAYTLQEIGHNLARSEAENPKIPDVSVRRKAPPSRFKPKAPALRYQQRHPDEFSSNHSNMDVDEPMVYDEEMDDDSDYIIDTYIRMPAHEIEGDDEKNFGLLVLDSQPDIDEFYREDEDDEDQENDEEEDENAEDHYTADYPDDEVDSDDEYDRNAYNYRNHNASDLEEFDENDEAFSDDEADGTRYPWDKKPVLLKSRFIGNEEDE